MISGKNHRIREMKRPFGKIAWSKGFEKTV